MNAPRIRCRGLTRRLRSGERELCVLDHVDLDVPSGEFCCILGPSGSGKSTLLGLLAGLDRPSEGTVEIDGQSLSELDEDGLALLRRAKIGFVFQSFQLLGNLTARENVLVPLELSGLRDAAVRADDVLERVGLAERRHHYPSQLSGGEQQRVAIARAFAPSPPIVLADEPTGNLDAETGERVLGLLEELGSKVTLVLVTHDESIAERADRRVRLARGRIASIETSDRELTA